MKSDQQLPLLNWLRLTATFGTSLTVFVLTYWAAWVNYSASEPRGDDWFEPGGINHRFAVIAKALTDFSAKYGRFPEVLEELKRDDKNLWFLDPWNRPLKYERTKDGFRLYSLGRDGAPGGVGLDADLEYDADRPVTMQPTIGQFVFESRGSLDLFIVALASSFCASMTCYLAVRAPRRTLPGMMGTLIGVGVIIVIALIIATGLVAVYAFPPADHH